MIDLHKKLLADTLRAFQHGWASELAVQPSEDLKTLYVKVSLFIARELEG